MRTVLILAHGEPPPAELLARWAREADAFVCVDGAVADAVALGLTPDAVLGDFDSLPAELPAGIEALAIPEQETTDLEKALYTVIDRGYERAVVLGAGGRRWDQFYQNLGVMAHYADRLALEAGDLYGWLTFLTPGPWHDVDLPPGTKLSLLPLPQADGVTIANVRWPLTEANLILSGASGISNDAAEPPVRIRYRAGVMAVYVVSGDA